MAQIGGPDASARSGPATPKTTPVVLPSGSTVTTTILGLPVISTVTAAKIASSTYEVMVSGTIVSTESVAGSTRVGEFYQILLDGTPTDMLELSMGLGAASFLYSPYSRGTKVDDVYSFSPARDDFEVLGADLNITRESTNYYGCLANRLGGGQWIGLIQPEVATDATVRLRRGFFVRCAAAQLQNSVRLYKEDPLYVIGATYSVEASVAISRPDGSFVSGLKEKFFDLQVSNGNEKWYSSKVVSALEVKNGIYSIKSDLSRSGNIDKILTNPKVRVLVRDVHEEVFAEGGAWLVESPTPIPVREAIATPRPTPSPTPSPTPRPFATPQPTPSPSPTTTPTPIPFATPIP
ncbi:MAG: hypothetical protein VKO21_10975 [Candidatus Sericytochromatia bacterium]|nr:hypothetical protein [Candidatus Sericytochromatia bacterium]